MKYILTAQVMNPYRRKYKWYDRIKGHTGVDLNYFNEDLPCPVTGTLEKVIKQVEMGTTAYIKDVESGNIHVFAHLKELKSKVGDRVERNQIFAKTGNTGTVSSGPHLHYEIITFKRPEKLLDRVMTRNLGGFSGWNIDPLAYIRNLYAKYNLNSKGAPLK